MLLPRPRCAPEELPQIFGVYGDATEYLNSLDYTKVLLDLEGYRRGKMNDAIPASTSTCAPIAFLEFGKS